MIRWCCPRCLGIVLSMGLALVGTDVAMGQSGEALDQVYQAIENQPNLTIAEKYERKMEAFNAALEAGNTYVSAFEDLATYTQIAREAGGIIQPGFGKKLEEFQNRLETAKDNRVFKTFGRVSQANEYVSQAITLVSEVNAILKDPELPPSARNTLVALRGMGEVLQRFGGSVPGIGAGLETYGNMVKELTGVVRQAAQNINTLKGGSFSLTEQRQLLTGLPPAESFYVRTPLYNQGFPVVIEWKSEQAYMKTQQGGWVEVPYDEVAAILAEHRFVNKGRDPTPTDILKYLNSREERENLSETARRRAEIQQEHRMMEELGAAGMDRTTFVDVKDGLQKTLRDLGLIVAPNSEAFKNLIRDQLGDPRSNDALLRRMALAAHPHAREYLRSLGVDPDKLSLQDLARHLKGYRQGGYRQFAKLQQALAPLDKAVRAVDAEPKAPKTTTVTAPPAPAPAPPAPARVTPTQPPPKGPETKKQAEECLKSARSEYESLQRRYQSCRSPSAGNRPVRWFNLGTGTNWQMMGPKAAVDEFYRCRQQGKSVDACDERYQEQSWQDLLGRERTAMEKKTQDCQRRYGSAAP